jgi:hypothetical protein
VERTPSSPIGRNPLSIDWKNELAARGIEDRAVLDLDQEDLRSLYGPMMNVLFSCSLESNYHRESPAGFWINSVKCELCT